VAHVSNCRVAYGFTACPTWGEILAKHTRISCYFSKWKEIHTIIQWLTFSATAPKRKNWTELDERLPPRSHSRPDRDRLTTEKTPPQIWTSIDTSSPPFIYSSQVRALATST
jgi:hypothetical protein